MKSHLIWIMRGSVLLAGVLCLALATSTSAQVQSQTTTTSGTPSKEIKIELGEVVAVRGNNLFVKMDDGTLRDFPNIPESARVTVDGQKLGIHDLRPGMKLQRTTVTTATPQVVTTIDTVTGKVWYIAPPVKVILTLENGQNQAFTIPEGQKFMVDGKETDAWGLKKGMTVTATKIVETPVTSVSTKKQVIGTLPADAPVLIAKGNPKPAPGAGTADAGGTATAGGTTTSASNKLPKTASDLPLIGFLGVLSVSASLGMRLLRRRRGLRG